MAETCTLWESSCLYVCLHAREEGPPSRARPRAVGVAGRRRRRRRVCRRPPAKCEPKAQERFPVKSNRCISLSGSSLTPPGEAGGASSLSVERAAAPLARRPHLAHKPAPLPRGHIHDTYKHADRNCPRSFRYTRVLEPPKNKSRGAGIAPTVGVLPCFSPNAHTRRRLRHRLIAACASDARRCGRRTTRPLAQQNSAESEMLPSSRLWQERRPARGAACQTARSWRIDATHR